MLPYRVNFEAIPWQSPMAGVRHKLFAVDGRVLRLVEYSQAMAPHWCDRGHVGHIVAGRMEIEFAAGRVTFEERDAVFIPAGPEHAHRAIALTPTVTALFVEDT